jgi:hypothetical protein
MPKEKLRVFVACPIGSDDSEDRRRSDQLLKHIISPVAEDLSYQVTRADKIAEPGRITLQIATELGSSDVVIVDLTTLNPNVMYELGARQGLGRPYILMAAEGQVLPFDLLDFRTIFYKLDLDGVEDARANLKSQLESALSDKSSIFNSSIFSVPPSEQDPHQSTQTDQRLMYVLEALGHFSRESEQTRDVMQMVIQVMSQLVEERQLARQQTEEQRNQEMGLWLMSQLIQNPESVEGVMSAIQTFQGFNPGAASHATIEKPLKEDPPPNRASRRKRASGS